jgi:hypothetical protein
MQTNYYSLTTKQQHGAMPVALWFGASINSNDRTPEGSRVQEGDGYA